MRLFFYIANAGALTAALSIPRAESTTDANAPSVQEALFDGQCFYPKPTSHFNLTSYLGTWYQVAGSPFGPTAGARCVTADYSLNDNGTVNVVNTATVGPQAISIQGTASAVAQEYGTAGAFKVSFPGTPRSSCPGPNYIVQEYCGDHAFVQTQNWTTLYILSRERNPEPSLLEAWVDRAVALGSDRSKISTFNQTGC